MHFLQIILIAIPYRSPRLLLLSWKNSNYNLFPIHLDTPRRLPLRPPHLRYGPAICRAHMDPPPRAKKSEALATNSTAHAPMFTLAWTAGTMPSDRNPASLPFSGKGMHAQNGRTRILRTSLSLGPRTLQQLHVSVGKRWIHRTWKYLQHNGHYQEFKKILKMRAVIFYTPRSNNFSTIRPTNFNKKPQEFSAKLSISSLSGTAFSASSS